MLVDLAATPDEALSATARLRAFLKALKYGRSPELPERLDHILAEAEALGRRDLLLILTYLDKGPVGVSHEVIRQVLHRRVPDREEQIMGWLTQPYFERGIEQGIQEGIQQGLATGRAEGRAEGQAKSLVRLLEKRFGPLPAHLRKRVCAADVHRSTHGSSRRSMRPICSLFSQSRSPFADDRLWPAAPDKRPTQTDPQGTTRRLLSGRSVRATCRPILLSVPGAF